MKSLIKFMTKEELVKMLVQIKNFRNPNTGKCYKKYQTVTYNYNKWKQAEHLFNMKRLDFVDVLICDEGYVRYYYKNDSVVTDMMKERFGFVEE